MPVSEGAKQEEIRAIEDMAPAPNATESPPPCNSGMRSAILRSKMQSTKYEQHPVMDSPSAPTDKAIEDTTEADNQQYIREFGGEKSVDCIADSLRERYSLSNALFEEGVTRGFLIAHSDDDGFSPSSREHLMQYIEWCIKAKVAPNLNTEWHAELDPAECIVLDRAGEAAHRERASSSDAAPVEQQHDFDNLDTLDEMD